MPVSGCGQSILLEIRLRAGAPPELVCTDGSRWVDRKVSKEDIRYCINMASRYSPWNMATSASGYMTAPGGHRIGLCGEAVCKDGRMTGLGEVNSLCIRIAKDIPGLAKRITGGENILILGAPGWGKTTLLRDLTRQRAERATVAVADERGELFPSGFPRGKRMDVLSGAPKRIAIEMLLRTMGPEYIAVDEITASEDCEALRQAACCGVKLLATAHGADLADYLGRETYALLHKFRIFDTIIVLRPDRSFRTERMDK